MFYWFYSINELFRRLFMKYDKIGKIVMDKSLVKGGLFILVIGLK